VSTPSALALARFVRHRPAVVSVALIVLLGIGTIFAGRARKSYVSGASKMLALTLLE